ncbi:hypothetical protein Btru_053691 [Bulinus truncatus]|nr:hypothetical protein Btru_053691 [Bulinus truncatus]
MDRTFVLTVSPLVRMDRTFVLTVSPLVRMDRTFVLTVSPLVRMDRTFVLTVSPLVRMDRTFVLTVSPLVRMDRTFVLTVSPLVRMDRTFVLKVSPLVRMDRIFLLKVSPLVRMDRTFVLKVSPLVRMDRTFVLKVSPLVRMDRTFVLKVSPLVRMDRTFVLKVSPLKPVGPKTFIPATGHYQGLGKPPVRKYFKLTPRQVQETRAMPTYEIYDPRNACQYYWDTVSHWRPPPSELCDVDKEWIMKDWVRNFILAERRGRSCFSHLSFITPTTNGHRVFDRWYGIDPSLCPEDLKRDFKHGRSPYVINGVPITHNLRGSAQFPCDCRSDVIFYNGKPYDQKYYRRVFFFFFYKTRITLKKRNINHKQLLPLYNAG